MNQLTNSSSNITVSELINFTSYDNSMIGIRTQYPSAWQNAEHNLGAILSIEFISPLQDDSDVFGDNINIAVEKLPCNADQCLPMCQCKHWISKQIYARF